ncbi:MAG: tetratricopeptide repeat protein [Acidobacteria bacterium]|nr:tetratricopeptide repeat protein [Acidobacteriota bacterium]
MKRCSLLLLLPAAVALLLMSGCNLDPNKAKVRYVENGDKYMAQGKLKEAILLYRNAIRKDPKYGTAYLKLGDAEAKRGSVREAVSAYNRAVELLPTAESEVAAGKLADIYLLVFAVNPQKNQNVLPEVTQLVKTLEQKNPSSFQALRLKGFLVLADEKEPDRYSKAISYFRRADALKPKQPELRFALCQVLTQTGEWAEGESIAKSIIADSPEFVAAYNFLVSNYLKRNDQAEAEKIVDLKIKNNPKVHRYVLEKAAFYWGTQRKDQADQILSGLLASRKDDSAVRTDVVRFFLMVREFDKAYKAAEVGAEEFAARRTDFRILMAQVRLAQGRQGEALPIVEQALKEDPSSTDALAMRSSLKLMSGNKADAEQAINDLQSLLNKTPDNVVVRYNLGKAYQSRGDLDAARVQYLEVVKKQPNMTAAQIGLGQIYLAKRDFGRTISVADEVLKYDAKNMPARLLKVNALIISGNVRQARGELTAYMADTPNSPDLKFQLASADFMENRLKEAEAGIKELRQSNPNDLRLTFAMAELLLRTNRQDEGLALLLEQEKKTPNVPTLREAVARTALRTGKLDVSEKEYRAMIAADPKRVDGYLGLGEVLRRKGQGNGALEALKKAKEVAPNDPGANLQLAMTMDNLGMQSQSLPLYETVVKSQPDNLIALNNLAFMYADANKDLEQALTYAQRARKNAPTNEDIADTLAWIYIKKNMNDNALPILNEITGKQPRNPTYHYHLGVALFQKGNKSAAKQSLQTALSLNPSKADEVKIRELLAKLG